jgi:hypothetical protein
MRWRRLREWIEESPAATGITAIIKAVSVKRPKTRYAVGAFALPSLLMSRFLSDRTRDWLFDAVTKSFLRRQQEKIAAAAT